MKKNLIHFLLNPLELDLNPFNLQFSNKDLEAEFTADFRNKKFTLAILFTILSTLIFVSFFEIYTMEHPGWFIAMIILSGLFGLSIYFKWIHKFHYLALFTYSLIIELSYNQRILLYNATDTAGLAEYFLGLMLIIIAVNSFIRLKFPLAVFQNSIFFIAFVLLAVWGLNIHRLNPDFFIYALILFVSIIIVVSVSIYNNEYLHRNAFAQHKMILKQAKELTESKDTLEQKVIERTLELELERSKKLKAIIEGQQIERQRLAQDLHDSLNIRLVILKRSLESVLQGKHNQLLTDIDSIISQVREISHNLLPYSLKHYGLLKAVEDLCSKIESENKLKVCFSKIGAEENSRWDAVVETELFRIIQELVVNCLKHAQASKLIIEIIASNDILYLTVSDNGIGFDTTKNDSNKFGTNNIVARIQLLGGTISFDSQSGLGTTVMINIPINSAL